MNPCDFAVVAVWGPLIRYPFPSFPLYNLCSVGFLHSLTAGICRAKLSRLQVRAIDSS